MTAFTEPEQCALCHNTNQRDLRYALVHWREAEPGMQYEWTGVCSDRVACRARVAASKKVWPLVETNEKRGAA